MFRVKGKENIMASRGCFCTYLLMFGLPVFNTSAITTAACKGERANSKMLSKETNSFGLDLPIGI